MKSHFIIIDNKKIHYRSTGQGTAVMLVHGFGEDGSIWDEQAAGLSEKFRLLIPDLPGSGQSESLNETSMESMADILHAILLEEKTEQCHLIGHSMGGYISLAFAEKFQSMLLSLGLIHSTAYPDSEEKKEIREKGIRFIEQYGAYEFLKTTVPNLFAPGTRTQAAEMIRNFTEQQSTFSGGALVAYYKAMMNRPDRTLLIKNLKKPVLLIAGEFDQAVPLIDCLKQSHLPEKCYFHLLKKSGHMGMLEEPHKSTRILETFLQQN